jgi:hypothetical protein
MYWKYYLKFNVTRETNIAAKSTVRARDRDPYNLSKLQQLVKNNFLKSFLKQHILSANAREHMLASA